MKMFLLAASLFVSSFSYAHTFTCTQDPKNAQENGEFDGQLQFSIDASGNMQLSVTGADGKVKNYSADRDDHDSYKDQTDDNFYNLDEDYDRSKEARFVSGDSDLAVSDADSIVFVEKSILAGKPGQLSLSGGQANDGDSGDAWLWFRATTFSCK